MRYRTHIIFVTVAFLTYGAIMMFLTFKRGQKEASSIYVGNETFLVSQVVQNDPFVFSSKLDRSKVGLADWQVALMVGNSNYSDFLEDKAIFNCYEVGSTHKKDVLTQAKHVSETCKSIDPPISYMVEQMVLTRDQSNNVFFDFLA